MGYRRKFSLVGKMMTSFGEYIDFEFFLGCPNEDVWKALPLWSSGEVWARYGYKWKRSLGIVVLDWVYLQIFLKATDTFHNLAITLIKLLSSSDWSAYFYFSPF